MRPQRRRNGNDNNAASCPMCGKVFPSVKNQDPMDLENMIVKHITKCSAVTAAKKAPCPTESVRSTSWTESLEGQNPATVTPTDSPIVGCSSKLPRVPSPVLGPEEEVEYCSMIEQIIEQDLPKVDRVKDQDKKLPAKVTEKTTTVNPHSMADSVTGSANERGIKSHHLLKTPTTTKVPSKAACRRVKVAKKPQESSTMHCPVCNKGFPQLKHKSSHADYERKVLNHVIACTKPVKAIPYKMPVAIKSSPWNNAPDLSVKIVSLPKPSTTSADSNDTSSTKSSLTPSSNDSKSSSSNSASAQQPSPPKKQRVIVDPGHFLAQTWWRKQKVKRCSMPLATFTLQQCLVEDDEQEDTLPRARGSSRRKSNNSKEPTLKLRCPICKRSFGADMLGDITEEAMSRHVTKCTQKMFDTGIDLSVYAQHASSSSSSSRSKGTALFSKHTSVESNNHNHSNTAAAAAATLARVRRRRGVLTEEERKQRTLALKERGKDMKSIMKGKGKRALDDLYLEHCNSIL